MNTRTKRFSRWPCELTSDVQNQIKQLADDNQTSNLEMTRRLINHALACPLFLPNVSPERNIRPDEAR